MIGDAIYNILYGGGSGDVFDIVGNKIWPDQARQDSTYPFIIYKILETRPSDEKDGASRLDVVRVSIECYADARLTARSAADAVRTALDRKAAGTYGGVAIDSIRFVDQFTAKFESDPHIFIFESHFDCREKR